MSMPTIILARSAGLPPGFSLVQEQGEEGPGFYLRRNIDDRRAIVEWKDGMEHYTPQWLSAQMSKDADYDNPLLKGLV